MLMDNVDGKMYIGSTVQLVNRRFCQHKTALRANCHSNKHFQYAYNKYGENSFIFESIIENEYECEKDLRELEGIFIRKYHKEVLYNFETHPHISPTFGKHRTMETKKKISDSNKGLKRSKEARKRMSESRKGTLLTAETKEKISKSHTGKKNHFYGKSHTKESKEKMSNILKGRKSWNKGMKNCFSKKSLISLSMNNPMRKLSIDNVKEIRKLCKSGKHTRSEIGNMYGVARTTVNDIHLGRSFKHV